MNVNWLVSDLNRADSIARQNEIRRQVELARAREIDRTSRPHRGLFGGRFAGRLSRRRRR